MIPKSMSRKTPSFGQLAEYMASQKSDGDFEIYQHCLARGTEEIAQAFLKNSQLLRARKNGNYLYHEILSITLEDGVDPKHAKQALRDLALKYVADRCPRNMVYGCLHDDHKNHIHYHLMISANEFGNPNRLRLTKKDFDKIKRDLENHTLEKYPELKQKKVITAEREEKTISRKAAEIKRRDGKFERRDHVKKTILEAMVKTRDFENFKALLLENDFQYYKRGKNHGVAVTHKDGREEKYRFSTLGIAEDFESFLAATERPQEREQGAEAPQGSEQAQKGAQGRSRAGKEEEMDSKGSDRLKKPSIERQELIDKGHAIPDPERDLMGHEDWRDQDKFTTKVQQSWRRTLDDDTAYFLRAGVNHQTQLDSGLLWRSAANLSFNNYSTANSYDTSSINVSTGPVFAISAKSSLSVPVTFDLQRYNSQGGWYSQNWGIAPRFSYKIQDNMQLYIDSSISRKRFRNDGARNLTAYTFNLSVNYQPRVNGNVAFGLNFGRENSGQDIYSNDVLGAYVGYQHSFKQQGITAGITASYTDTKFEGIQAAYTQARHDISKKISLSASYLIPEASGLTLRGNVSYQDNNSNLDINTYDRTNFSISLTKSF